MDEYGKKLIDKIQKEHITPRPKSVFIIKNIIFWTLCILSILTVAFISSKMLYLLIGVHTFLPKYTGADIQLPFIIQVFISVWIVIVIIAAILIPISIRHTKRGYKHPTLIIAFLLTSIAIFVMVGYIVRSTREEDRSAILNNLYGNKRLEKINNKYWVNPSKGRLEGKIISIDGDSIFIQVKPPRNRKNSHTRSKETDSVKSSHDTSTSITPIVWELVFDDNSKTHPFAIIRNGEKVKVRGEALSNNKMLVHIILPPKRLTKHIIESLCRKDDDDDEGDDDDNDIARRCKKFEERKKHYKDGLPPKPDKFQDHNF